MLAGRLEYFEGYHSVYHFMVCATAYEVFLIKAGTYVPSLLETTAWFNTIANQ